MLACLLLRRRACAAVHAGDGHRWGVPVCADIASQMYSLHQHERQGHVNSTTLAEAGIGASSPGSTSCTYRVPVASPVESPLSLFRRAPSHSHPSLRRRPWTIYPASTVSPGRALVPGWAAPAEDGSGAPCVGCSQDRVQPVCGLQCHVVPMPDTVTPALDAVSAAAKGMCAGAGATACQGPPPVAAKRFVVVNR